MLEQKVISFNKAIEEKKSKEAVKYLFLDYKESYHVLRNPTTKQTEEYLQMYLRYMTYCASLKTEVKYHGKNI